MPKLFDFPPFPEWYFEGEPGTVALGVGRGMLVPDKDITHRPRSHPRVRPRTPWAPSSHLGEKLTPCDRFWRRHEGVAGTIEAGRTLISRAK